MRLVGYYEYANALNDLDTLINQSTDEELYELDKMVAERDEFTVYTNLSQKLSSGASSLDEPRDEKREQRGLRWVTALARTELGAILAASTGTPKPFEIVANPKFDLEQYRKLLLDGARTHYWALANDPQLREVTRSLKVNTQVLSYGRRLVMARAMLRAVLESSSSYYTPVQLRELYSWKESLDESQALLTAKIRAHIQGTVSKSDPTTTSKEFVYACGIMLRGEAREVAAGTATITNY